MSFWKVFENDILIILDYDLIVLRPQSQSMMKMIFVVLLYGILTKSFLALVRIEQLASIPKGVYNLIGI